MSLQKLQEIIKREQVEFVDLRFTDLQGKEHHVTIPAQMVDNDFETIGKAIDGSSIKGWQEINCSDLALIPCFDATINVDPFYRNKTINLRCKVQDLSTGKDYDYDPRTIAMKAEKYLKTTGIADSAFFGPEPEFFIFDDVRWENEMGSVFYQVDSHEAAWNSSRVQDGGNTGHRPSIKGGYFPVPPVDSSQDLRSAISSTLAEMGIVVEAHHHEVATANQCEVATKFGFLTQKADELQVLKYVIHNTAHQFGKTATFMPKPLVGDNGSGMHCHQSLALNGENIFAGDGYGGLSETALFYIGGILTHAKALNAITNPTINSYRRLVPGYEAPTNLAYGYRNRSAAIRIPFITNPKAKRIEVRFPDCMANPYLAFSAMMLAGLDGIQRKIHPGQAMENNLYHLSPEEEKQIPQLCSSLEMARSALEQDYEFLLSGGVFTQGLVNTLISFMDEEINMARLAVHPLEFALYYSR
ncbi:MAG TPA: type I glutamate--ammonia ligase [Legionellales bacterium]|nr:type I glutamate--ammonia ligase [Legionellales bacterium]